jgi:hypothetical protein
MGVKGKGRMEIEGDGPVKEANLGRRARSGSFCANYHLPSRNVSHLA